MKPLKKGADCHVMPGNLEKPTLVIAVQRAPLKRVEAAIRELETKAEVERHGILWFLMTELDYELLPEILLDHFDSYFWYEDHGADLIKVSDPDGNVTFDKRGEGDEDTSGYY